MFRPLLVVFAVAIALAIAWFSGWIKPDAVASQRIDSQRVDSDTINYRRLYFEAAVLRDGERFAEGHDLYIKPFERDGKLALCGFAPIADAIADRTRAWLDKARLEVAGQRLRADFIAVQKPGFIESDAEAGCMLSELAWTPDYLTAPMRMTGVPLLNAQ